MHIHRDPDWQQIGIHRYDACRCGARRVRLVALYGMVCLRSPHGWWPPLLDKHGRDIVDTGWQFQGDK